MNNKKLIVNLSESELENISGGYEAIFCACNSLRVSKKEYEKLVEAGYIVDGKIKHDDVSSAVEFLGKKGFKGITESLCFMYQGYKPPEYGELIVTNGILMKLRFCFFKLFHKSHDMFFIS